MGSKPQRHRQSPGRACRSPIADDALPPAPRGARAVAAMPPPLASRSRSLLASRPSVQAPPPRRFAPSPRSNLCRRSRSSWTSLRRASAAAPPSPRAGICAAAPPPPWCCASLRRAAAKATSALSCWRRRRARRCQDCSPAVVAAAAKEGARRRARRPTRGHSTPPAGCRQRSRPQRAPPTKDGGSNACRRRGSAPGAAIGARHKTSRARPR